MNIKRLGFLLERKDIFKASRYKYFELFKQMFELRLFYNTAEGIKSLRSFSPDAVVVMGDHFFTYSICVSLGIPYILIENDVATMRSFHGAKVEEDEKKLIRSAIKIIFTSEEHQKYVIDKYGIDEKRTTVVHLRPLKKDLLFRPHQKTKKKTLVYVGGVGCWRTRNKALGYRSYYAYFKQFVLAGWEVHIYSRDGKIPNEYIASGCIEHKTVQQCNIYKEISRYTAGFQGYNHIGVPKESLEYVKKCRPNKLWEYLAAGIPTIGYNGGRGMKIYDGKWGISLPNLKVKTIMTMKLPKISQTTRMSEVIDSDRNRVREWMLS